MKSETFDSLIQFLQFQAGEIIINVVAAALILIVGFWFAGRLKRLTARLLSRSGKLDTMLVGILASAVRYLVIVLTVIAVLERFGVETASIIAVLGTAGLAIGLALQGTLSNVAAGLMILILRPFRAGDFIDAGGTSGTVITVSPFATELKSVDGVCVLVPNSVIWSSTISNFSRNATRRVDVVASIAYSDDLQAAQKLLSTLMEKDERFLSDPAPIVFVAQMAASSVDLQLRGWVKASDYWDALWDTNKAVKLGLEEQGFTIPFPQRDLYIYQADQSVAAKGGETTSGD